MSRIAYADYDEDTAMPPQLFEANLVRALDGRRGQRALRDLIAALEALPERRLINDDIMGRPSGEVCAVGAYALHMAERHGFKRARGGARYDDRADYLEHLAGIESDFATMEEAATWGMTRTLAWAIMELNDEAQGDATEEQRYAAILRWARERLIEETAA